MNFKRVLIGLCCLTIVAMATVHVERVSTPKIESSVAQRYHLRKRTSKFFHRSRGHQRLSIANEQPSMLVC